MEIFNSINEKKFSVLMSVYKNENPEFFCQAVESVMNNTVRPAEIVIVKDGKLPQRLENVCNKILTQYPRYIHFVPLKKNVGLGIALQRGLLECHYDLVARMDTDDIAKPYRFEKQLKVFAHEASVDVCGGWIEEFSVDVEKIDNIRKVPETTKEIYNFAKKRNPFNHMTVMFRKEAVIKVGSYQHFPLLEDYYLWFRMIINKCRMYNIQEILCSVRTGKSMIARRGGLSYFKNEKKLYDCFYKQGYISAGEYITTLTERFIARIAPKEVRALMYRLFLRG
ncbi:glycosyltransferase [Selenomonas ruminantium]|uniref:Glycosyl transferase family 2 n=1 Tax=Selenomonas ruminantium TaxID=971 RepID=A0A1K1NNN4_SELRU|nr:glycosyltransferase [Selenomonas ruminantium]SFW36875.1 Glycosyl transferase family 2 [Selenomonas ruminantium]